jgi:hypothetical protein
VERSCGGGGGLQELWIVACVRFARARKGRSVLGGAMSFAPQASQGFFALVRCCTLQSACESGKKQQRPDAFCGPDLTGSLGFVEMDCGHV